MANAGWRQIEIGGGIALALVTIIWPTPPAWLKGFLILLALAFIVDGLHRIFRSRETGATPSEPPLSVSGYISPFAGKRSSPPSVRPPTSNAIKIAALILSEPKFTFTAASDGTLTDGRCTITITNQTHMTLKECLVVVESVTDGHAKWDTNSAIRTVARDADGSIGRFKLSPKQLKTVLVAKRNYKDVVSRPPWLLKLESGDVPLHDGSQYELLILLHSEYEFPTKARLQLSIGPGKSVAAEIIGQSV